MSLHSSLRRSTPTDNSEYIPRQPQRMSLDDLYTEAASLGAPKLGLTFASHGAEIKLHSHLVRGDYIWICSKVYPTVAQNLAACIQRANKVIDFYNTI